MSKYNKNTKNLDIQNIFDNFEKEIKIYLAKERFLLEKILSKLEKK